MRNLQDLKMQDENAEKREKQIIKTSIVGIIANVVLAIINKGYSWFDSKFHCNNSRCSK